MCEPISAGTIMMAGLSAVSSMDAIGKQNSAALANANNANQAANDQYASTNLKFIEENRSLIQGGFDSVLAGRAGESMAYTSAIENGVQGNSVKATLRSMSQKTQRGISRTTQESSSLRAQTGANLKNIQTTTQGRINQVPTTKFGLGDMASMLAPIAKSQL